MALTAYHFLNKASVVNQQIIHIFQKHKINVPQVGVLDIPSATSQIPLMQSQPSSVKHASPFSLAPAAVKYER